MGPKELFPIETISVKILDNPSPQGTRHKRISLDSSNDYFFNFQDFSLILKQQKLNIQTILKAEYRPNFAIEEQRDIVLHNLRVP